MTRPHARQFDGLLNGDGRVLLAAVHRQAFDGRVLAEYEDFSVISVE